ncbi:hypothetical protein NLX83_40090 [Allokutzneria sp. A3M-2-11 16]|uniref:hypothetical protein n=1 Tax=Allokutzneria sp. A3M-2-11 16 TaxID=2962043 RepID=UPI0020B8073F|nr:hypothetical protein [Allokutzneria sp. A3M-2-11 16]MCP3805484.1 hypothetical protein [Allokutzneria sp. A3M-2-11 16]
MMEVWLVRSGDTVLAELHDVTVDMPWFTARLRPRLGFEAVRPLFVDELRLLSAEPFDDAAWESTYERVAEAVVDFLLHIDGEEALRAARDPGPRGGCGRSANLGRRVRGGAAARRAA